MNYQRFVVGNIATNCYVVWSGNEAGIIDPGGEIKDIVALLEHHALQVKWIVNTHGHFDHIAGNQALQEKYKAPIWIHTEDEVMLSSAEANLSAWMGQPITSPPASKTLTEGDIIPLGSESLTVLHTPGHTPGGISLYTQGLVFTGDALFYESIGRTDFPDGNHQQLVQGIREKLLTLPPETVVLPGHDCLSTIAHEIANNPLM